MSSRPSTFAALRHRNFRLLWIGQIISLCGSMMQSTAILWHVTLLVSVENKALALAMVGVSRVVPIVAFSLVGGVVADALDRRRLMLATQTLATLVAALLAWLTFRGLSSPLPIYVLAALSSAVNAFDAPARQALLPSLVPRAVLPNALSLYSTMFQVASVAGPALAGLMLGATANDATGPGFVYAANAVSFLAVIVSLLMMRDLPERAGGERKPVRAGSAMEGLRFVFREPLIRSTMLLDFFATFFASAMALLPIFAQDILHVGERGYGLLSSAQAVGAFVAGIAMAHFEPVIRRRGPVLLWAVAAYGLSTIGFGLSPTFLLAFLCLALSGAADTVSMVLRNIIRQTRTPDELRGRMTSVNMIFFMGGPQLGETEAGLVAKAFGAVASVVSGGIGCLIATAWVAKDTPALRAYGRDEEPITPELAQKAVSQQPEPASQAGG